MPGSSPPGPDPEALRERLAALSPAQRAALRQRLGLDAPRPAQPAQTASAPAPRAVAVSDSSLPLTLPTAAPLRVLPAPTPRDPARTVREHLADPGLHPLWFLHHFADGAPVYNSAFAFRLEGPLDTDALARAFDALVGRHDALRATFDLAPTGELVLRIASSAETALPLTDLSRLPAPAAEQAASEALLAFVRAPFDLEQGPLLRVQLFRLRPDRHLLAFVVHHLVYDGWSRANLHRDLAALYADPATPLPAPPAYADHTAWRHQRLASASAEAARRFWREHLAGLDSVPKLPPDASANNTPPFAGAALRERLDPALWSAVRQRARDEGVTLFVVVFTAYVALLRRHSTADDVCVGVPTAGRLRPEVEASVGCFMRMLALRVSLPGDPGLRALLGEVARAAAAASEHQEFTPDYVPELSAGRGPVYQTLFALQNFPRTDLTLAGLAVTPVPVHPGASKVDLAFTVEPDTDPTSGASVFVEYNPARFSPNRVRRFVDEWLDTLRQLATDPSVPLSCVPFALAERHHLLVELNQTAADYPRERCIHQLFDEQAARTPHAIALVSGDTTLTYAQLAARVHTAALRLRALGVGPDETPVGVYLDRSPDLVVSLLALLKAGGAYVPLAKDYPAERLRFMLADSRLSLVIADTPLPPSLPFDGTWLTDLHLVAGSASDPTPSTLEDPPPSPDRLAYVIYTSGSTGTPKGVAVSHRAVARLVRGQSYADFSPDDRFLLLAPTSFDASTFELWGPLLNGARCVIAPEGRLDFGYLEALVRNSGVTCLWLTAGLFNHLADLQPSFFGAPSLRHVLTGGEALSVPHVQRVRSLHSRLRLTNGYGPTECTTFALTHAIAPDETFSHGSVPIGRPIANTTAYLLDSQLRPVPLGVPGELFLGGDGLARGYLNQSALTAEKFIPHPFSSETGARLYRTGDRCRQLPDGKFEFLGRLDHQVKIRGFRIEPGEIEAALASLSSVSACTVLAREDSLGEKRLVAYVVPAPDSSPTPDSLRSQLSQRLPDHLVPGAFVLLPSLPLTPNGKVDRLALPSPEAASAHYASPHDRTEADNAPRPGLEQDLATVWAEALGHPVGRHDNFFAAGGHSLLAARISSALLRRTGRRLPIAVFFTAPTVAKMAAWLQDAPDAPPSRSLVTLQPLGTLPPVFCVHGWGGYAYGYLDFAKAFAPDRPVYGVQALGLDGRSRRHNTVEEMVAHYAAEIRAHQPRGPCHLVGFSAGGWMAYALACELRRQGAHVGLLVLLDSSGNAQLPAPLRLLEAVTQMRRRAAFLWRDRRAFWQRCRSRPGLGAPFLLRRLEQFLRPRPMALPRVSGGADLAPPVLRPAHGQSADLADYYHAAVTAYRARPYNGDAVLFASESTGSYRLSFWHFLVRGKLAVRKARGNHLGLLDIDNVRPLVAQLQRLLADADRRSSS